MIVIQYVKSQLNSLCKIAITRIARMITINMYTQRLLFSAGATVIFDKTNKKPLVPGTVL